jgi:hypothetical protein
VRSPLQRRRTEGEGSPFERLKRDLEEVDCETGLLWRSEIRTLPRLLEPEETMEMIVACELDDDPALAVLTDRRLLVVTDDRTTSISHGSTTRLEASEDWADDIELRFVSRTGELVLTDISEEAVAARLYARLCEQGRVPDVVAKKGVAKKLRAGGKGPSMPFSAALPDPTRGLNVLRRRWILEAIGETGPQRRSLQWIAHALFYAAAWTAALAVMALILLVIVAIVLFVIYS